MLTGLLLAAGRGKRMGGTKQLVSWPLANGRAQPLVAAAYDAIAPVCDEMIVVLGHEAAPIASILTPRKFNTVEANPDGQMFDSIRAGLSQVAAGHRVLLHLGDHPRVNLSTLRTLLAQADKNPAMAILPSFHGKGGHPILIPPNMVADLLTARVDAGLKSYWQHSPESYVRIEVNDHGIHCDIDTPDDLKNAGKHDA